MDNNGKINRGIDLGTTNSAIAVMENGVPVIKKSNTQKDTIPSIVSITRKGIIHTGDTAANELANQVLRATKTWDGRTASTDIFKEFKRTMGTVEIYHSKNLKKDFTSQQLSAEIIKALAANAGVNDGGCIVISVPAKFDATQKTATVEAARLAGFQHVELLQEPIAAAIAYGVATGQKDGFWLVFDLGGGTFDAALLRVDGGVQQVVDTEGDSYLGGKDIDYALVDSILLPYVKKHFKVDKILASEKKAAMLRETLKGYAESAKVQLSTAPCAEILSDLGELGSDDTGKEIELDLTITREMAYPIMEPFFKKAVAICQKILQRNHLDGKQLTKLILVGGPTYSPYLRQMLKEEVSPNIDTSVDPMTAVAKGATLYAATRDIPEDLMAAPDADAIEIEMHYDTMSTDLIAFIAIKVKDKRVMTEGMSVEVVRGDGAWSSGKVPYEDSGIVIDLSLAEHTANNFTVRFTNDFGHNVKVTPDNLTILQGLQVSAAPLPFHVGFGVWNEQENRQEFVPFLGLEKSKPVPAHGVANGRKTTMRLMPNNETTILKIPVYQAASYVPNSPADLYEHVADLIVTGKDVEHEIPAGTEVEVQVSVDSSEMMNFEIYVPKTDETIEKTLDTTPRFSSQDASDLIAKYADHARQTLSMLESENVAIEVLKNRLYALRNNRRHTETKAIVEQYKELLRDIYRLECDTAWERIIRKVEKEMALLKLTVSIGGDDNNKHAFHYLEGYIASAKENRDVAAAKKILEEIEYLSLDLRWKHWIPNDIKWYDRNFDNVVWSDKEHARWCIDQALEMISKEFTKEEGLKAIRRIQSAKESWEEIREAEGLLG
mgnify:CR=1 FL=1